MDNPVGAGYSYVNDSKLFPKNNSQIAQDLTTLMKGFFAKVSRLHRIWTWRFYKLDFHCVLKPVFLGYKFKVYVLSNQEYYYFSQFWFLIRL